jgi:hypothetical protein
VSFDAVWSRVVAAEGQEFRQVRGKAFTYSVQGNAVVPSTTNRVLPRALFERAWERLPVAGPGELQDLQGPSYLFAILSDCRGALRQRRHPTLWVVRSWHGALTVHA